MSSIFLLKIYKNLFYQKSSFHFWDILIFALSSSTLFSIFHCRICWRSWLKINRKVYDIFMCLNVNLYFERRSLKILKKSNFIFVAKAILFLLKLFWETKGSRATYQSLSRLPNMFKSILFLEIHQLPSFGAFIQRSF